MPTYLNAGHGLIVRQHRQNENCSVLEELEPIDENRRYDFNYQQINHLPREVKILPVSPRVGNKEVRSMTDHNATNFFTG